MLALRYLDKTIMIRKGGSAGEVLAKANEYSSPACLLGYALHIFLGKGLLREY